MKMLATNWRHLFERLSIVLFLGCSPAVLQAQVLSDAANISWHKLSIEQLLQMDITSVSRSEEKLGEAAAAVTVVSNEEIRRSGASSIPEALRMVPGISVARRNSNSWAVSSRGFSSINSEKLLVLSDSRSVYTPLFSGVFWDSQTYLMEDIDRIEVIRGPGASLWGSNAVNGVINIGTKDARETQGLYFEAGGGTEERAVSAVRYGGRLSDDVYYRIFGQYSDIDNSYRRGSTQSDDWRMLHFGFRSDWHADGGETLTVQGDAYGGNVGQLAPSVSINSRAGPEEDLDVGVHGGNVLARWTHEIDSNSKLELRAYYDRTRRNDPTFEDYLDTGDLDFQHTLGITPGQVLVWGAEYRHTSNRNQGKGLFALEPSSSEDDLFSAFVQDQIGITDTLKLTAGTKAEHNDFSGFEVQPSVRVAWDMAPKQTLWSAVSRAVRVPSRIERDISIEITDPAGASDPKVRLSGNRGFDSERLIAYEAGYRCQALDSVAIDLAAFYNDYDKLASLEIGEAFTEPLTQRTIVPVVNENLTEGHTKGVEILVSYTPLSNWRLTGTYSYIDVSLTPHGMDLNRGQLQEGSTPSHQFGVRSLLDLPGGFEFDIQLRSNSAVRKLPEDPQGGGVGNYTELNARLGIHVTNQVEISLNGQNLLHGHHAEFGSAAVRGEIERCVFGKLIYRF